MKLAYDHPKFETLSLENIEKAVGLANAFLTENGIEYERRTLCRPILENILLSYRQKDENAPFELICKRAWRKIEVKLLITGAGFNVLEADQSAFPEDLPGAPVENPTWEYKHGVNTLCFDLPVKVPDKEALMKLLQYIESEKGAFRQGVIMRVLNMLMLVLEPWFAAKIIEGLTEADISKILTYTVLVLAIEFCSSLFTYWGTNYLERAYTVMLENIRIDLTENVLRIKTEHIDTSGTGIFTERIITESARVVNGIDEMVLVLTELFRLISLLIAFATFSWFMLIFELILFFAYFLIVRNQSKKKNEDSRRVSAASEAFSGFIGEMVRACRDIKVLHCEESFLIKAKDVIRNLSDRRDEQSDRNCRHTLVRSQFVAWTDLLYMLILALMMSKYGLSPATALILYNYNGKVCLSARAVAGASDAFYALLLASEHVYQLFENTDFSKETFGEKSLEGVSGDIELKDVSFSYEHKDLESVPVLKGLSLRVPAGHSVALIGRSGCGKSTVFSLISRLYEPSCGSITLDGVDTSELNQDTIRDNIGTVTQSPYLFNMSIRDNFTLIKSDATDDEIVEVCKMACIHDDILKMSKGYDTVVGEGGILLSGGQRQRIALARALLKNYPVIMLDEATSALDNETQAIIRDAIKNMHGKSTVIMIAHRLSTVINCEQLFYLENGKVLAAGTHDELMRICEEYRKLYNEEAG